MNVSIENQVVWLAPERTASSITKKVLEKYNFFSKRKKNNYKLVNFQTDEQSHENMIDEEYSNFKVISNIRNPYDRVFACYQKYYLEKPIYKNSKDFSTKFQNWVRDNFWSQGPYFFLSPRYDDGKNFFQKWTFENQNVDFFVRSENLLEDILNLPFVIKSEDEKQRIHSLINDNPYRNQRYFSFQEAYDHNSAKLVYEYFKPCFYKFNYSPFSFTKEELTDHEKILFLHHNFN